MRTARLLCSLLFLSGCASNTPPTAATPGSVTEGEGRETAQATPTPSPFAKDPLYEPARQFDQFVHGALSPEETTALRADCKAKAKSAAPNPFCFALKRAPKLARFFAVKAAVRQAPTPPTVVPLVPVKADGQVTNWRDLRRGKIPALLKGIQDLPVPDLHLLAQRALAEKKCPNNIAVATAATLEDSLPDRTILVEISKLYEKGARCAGRDAGDRENFHTRAALLEYWYGDYAAAAAILSKVRPADAYSGRSLYWLYRARQAAGDPKGANKAFKNLTVRHPLSFHALLALLRENVDPGEKFLREAAVMKKRSRRSKNVNQIIDEAETLRRFNFNESATWLVDWAAGQRSWKCESEVRLYLATLGDDRSRVATFAPLLVHKTSLWSRESMKNLFPNSYQAAAEKNANGVDPWLLLSIAKKESAFDPKAISNANAQGLLQLNPKTADLLMNGAPANLLDPETNISLGSRYMNDLLKKMEGQLPLAIAAYNAGDPPVFSWKKRLTVPDPILFLDLIPYRETRDYVGYVLTNYYWYHRIYRLPVPDLFKALSHAS